MNSYVSSDVTLPEHLLFQLQCCGISDEDLQDSRRDISLNPWTRMVILTSSVKGNG